MKSRLIFVIFLVILFSGKIYAREKTPSIIKIKKSEFKTDIKEGFEEAWFNIKQGNILFLEGIGTYSLARDFYLQAHQYNNDNAALNYLIGVCYLYTDDKYEAIKYFRKAYDKNPKISPDIHFLLGRAYHLVLEFNRAIDEYNAFLKSLPSDELGVQGAIVNKLIQECINGKSIVENRKRVIITNLGDSINSQYDDYFSILSSNDSTIFFTSRRYLDKRSKRNPYDNKYYENIFSGHLKDGKWTKAQPLPKKINGSGNKAVVGASADGSTLYIYKGKEKGGDIFTSNKKNGEWTSPNAMSSHLLSDQAETSVFITPSGDTMYYISANKDLTLGGRDILRTVKNAKGKWGKPVNLSSILNTTYDEEGIFITSDGRELYFSSKGHNTMGGYDIFKSVLQSDGTWGDPENLGYPVNSADDDMFYSVSSNGKYGYYTTIREDGFGAKDIYKVTFLGSEKELQLEKSDIFIAGLIDSFKKGFFYLPVPMEVESSYYITGKVLDKKTNEPVNAKLEFIDVSASKIIATGVTGDSGMFRIKLDAAKQYGVEIIARDYLFFLDAVDMTNADPDEAFIRDFKLEKIEVGVRVVLENIYFETGKAILTVASYPQLNHVVDFLKGNESVRLEISGHTDNVGSVKINTKLSNDRARAVVDYMVANGIEKSRLESQGYGFSQPVAPNNTPEGRERNRRVEFKVISK
jgi:flagellar motor protein MotB/tetratricopeptide (TPR) repeat protein